MHIRSGQDEQLWNDAVSVRRTVFVDEQNVPEEEEVDHLEKECTHFVLYHNNEPAGAGRLRSADGYAKVERICVLPELRGKGAGQLLMNDIEETARKQGFEKAKLNAQTHAEAFYSRLGYETVSDVFMDAGIPHVTMVKKL